MGVARRMLARAVVILGSEGVWSANLLSGCYWVRLVVRLLIPGLWPVAHISTTIVRIIEEICTYFSIFCFYRTFMVIKSLSIHQIKTSTEILQHTVQVSIHTRCSSFCIQSISLETTMPVTHLSLRAAIHSGHAGFQSIAMMGFLSYWLIYLPKIHHIRNMY